MTKQNYLTQNLNTNTYSLFKKFRAVLYLKRYNIGYVNALLLLFISFKFQTKYTWTYYMLLKSQGAVTTPRFISKVIYGSGLTKLKFMDELAYRNLKAVKNVKGSNFLLPHNLSENNELFKSNLVPTTNLIGTEVSADFYKIKFNKKNSPMHTLDKLHFFYHFFLLLQRINHKI